LSQYNNIENKEIDQKDYEDAMDWRIESLINEDETNPNESALTIAMKQNDEDKYDELSGTDFLDVWALEHYEKFERIRAGEPPKNGKFRFF
jgi:hypothetical protein